MATVFGKIIRGATAGIGSILSLVPVVGPVIGAAVTAIGAAASVVKKSTDKVSTAVSNAVNNDVITTPQDTPATITKTGTGLIITTPMWIVFVVGGFLLLKSLKILR
jgi:hypothetical protein